VPPNRLARLLRAANVTRLATLLLALWKLFKHPETPRAAKIVAIAVLGYALSPIDLIPDFIPVLGLLDEVVLLPLGIALAIKLTPPALWEARLREAQASAEKLPRMKWGAALIVLVWVVVLGFLAWWLVSVLGGG
jgi:uncharacterized membrane protein YkvA (DUF1232 family)